MCRFHDFYTLRECDFIDNVQFIEVNFQRSKNDQYYQESKCIIPKRDNVFLCPVELVRLYFKTFGFSFGSGTRYLNFRYKKSKKGIQILPGRLCLSNAVRDMRNMLSNLEIDSKCYTEKSFKVGAVTAATEAGISLDEIAFHGRWLCRETPRHYRNLSNDYRQKLASRIPL